MSMDIRSQVEIAIIESAKATGWDGIDLPALVQTFAGKAARASIYRWATALRGVALEGEPADILRAVQKGRPGHLAREINSGDPGRVKEAVKEVRHQAAALMPILPSLDETAAVIAPIPVMEKLQKCLQAAQDVMTKSRDAAGGVRNSKMLLMASEHLRRSLDTAVKLQEAIADGLQIEQFHAICLEEIEKCDPATAHRIVRRLQEVNASWASKE